jgi:hypothetical protein
VDGHASRIPLDKVKRAVIAVDPEGAATVFAPDKDRFSPFAVMNCRDVRASLAS